MVYNISPYRLVAKALTINGSFFTTRKFGIFESRGDYIPSLWALSPLSNIDCPLYYSHCHSLMMLNLQLMFNSLYIFSRVIHLMSSHMFSSNCSTRPILILSQLYYRVGTILTLSSSATSMLLGKRSRTTQRDYSIGNGLKLRPIPIKYTVVISFYC